MSDDFDPDFDKESTALVLTDDEKTMAMLAHGLSLVTGVIGPLITLLVKGEESKFVKYHAMQSLIAMGFQLVGFIAFYIFMLVTCGFGALLLPFYMILVFAPPIYFGAKAYSGVWVGYPGLDKIGRN